MWGEDRGGNSLEDPVCLSDREYHQVMAREAWTCSCFPDLLLHLLQQFSSTASATLTFTAALVVRESLSWEYLQSTTMWYAANTFSLSNSSRSGEMVNFQSFLLWQHVKRNSQKKNEVFSVLIACLLPDFKAARFLFSAWKQLQNEWEWND